MKRGSSSALEKQFAFLWVHVVKGSTDVVAEHQFCPGRKWRFDFAHVQKKVAIEIEGASGLRTSKSGKVFTGGHTSREGFAKDCEKYNEATRLGWRVFRLTGQMLNTEELEKVSAFINQQTVLN